MSDFSHFIYLNTTWIIPKGSGCSTQRHFLRKLRYLRKKSFKNLFNWKNGRQSYVKKKYVKVLKKHLSSINLEIKETPNQKFYSPIVVLDLRKLQPSRSKMYCLRQAIRNFLWSAPCPSQSKASFEFFILTRVNANCVVWTRSKIYKEQLGSREYNWKFG